MMMTSENKIKKQIKFAVVMYGGGSLAIYINGVAQELLKLAQATGEATVKFDGTTLIYRKIALLLSGDLDAFNAIEKRQKEIAELSQNAKTSAEKEKIEAKKEELQAELGKAKPNVEFILDVLTGSSAGGINAVFLAKALVNGAKNMDGLQELWLEQGDFTKLLNDRQSVADNSLNVPQEPESLLNSQRMYLELLKALDKLDNQSDAGEACVKLPALLDLYVTYTDFEGLPTNLVLADKTVLERVHKRVFNFRHAPGNNDFGSENNPFLAFAARCTSSFPLAFEPMRLKDIDDIIDTALPEHEDGNSECSRWMQYFSDLTDENGKSVDWKNRWFVDGGCLDNKPFGYAIDKLTQRTGEGIVERKLLYIEPNPESFRNLKNRGRKPNALENVFGQASGLPSYETIREDLRRVLDRNRLIERVARITAEVESDFNNNPEWFTGIVDPTIDWSTADLDDVAKLKGAAFIPYYRLRVSSTTDEIARLVTRYFKIDDDSDYFNALRCLIRGWRELNYREYKIDEKDDETFNKFLYQYDVEYRLRRLRFILQKAEYMLRCKDDILRKIDGFKEIESETAEQQQQYRQAATNVLDTKNGVLSLEAALFAALPGETDGEKRAFAARFDSENYVEAVIRMQSELGRIYSQLRRETDFLRENPSSPPLDKTNSSGQPVLDAKSLQSFQEKLREVEKKLGELEESLKQIEKKEPSGKSAEPASGLPSPIAALERILNYIRSRKKDGCTDIAKLEGAEVLNRVYGGELNLTPLTDALKVAADTLDAEIINKEGSFLRRASSEAKALLGIENNRGQSDGRAEQQNADAVKGFDASTDEAKFVRRYLKNYYELFDSYDQISFPLFFESPVGEAVKVDVIRISSRDAHSLINEEEAGEERRKLAGDYLFAFGAFLDPRWRLNDIMWGRLDGAERLITTLLHNQGLDGVRDALIEEANKTILAELLKKKAEENFQGTVIDALTLVSTEAVQREAVDKLVWGLTTPVIKAGLTSALTTGLDENEIYKRVKGQYVVNRQLEPQPTLKMISRSTQIIGKILQDITEERAQMGDRLSWIAKLGQIFWGLVTVAAPNSIWNLLFNYWIQLLYLFETLVIIGATIFVKPEVQQFGIIALIVTLGIHLTVIALEEVMLGNNFWKTLLRFLIGSVLAIFVVVGALFFYSVFFDGDVWAGIVKFRELLATPGFERWHKLIPFVPFAMVFVVLALWREAEKLNLAIIGRALIIAFLAVAGLGVYFDSLTGGGNMIKLEFISNGKALIDFVAGLGQQKLDGMKTALWLDSFAFVPLYWGFLVILSRLLNRRRQKWANTAAITAVLCASAGAAADFVENYFSFAALRPGLADAQQLAERVTVAAEIKWLLVFVAVGILGSIFLRSNWRNLWNLAAVLLMLGALAGIVGTFTYSYRPVFDMELVNLALIAEFLILVIAGIAFQFRILRRHFLRGY